MKTDVAAVGRERPRWLAPASLALSVVGLLTSGYLTFEHYTGNTTLACSVNSVVDCERVTTSAWSTLFGIPVALLGLLFFVATTVLCLPSVWRRREAWLDPVRLGWLSVGLLFVLYLVWAELFQIHAICLWCTVVHIVTFALWILVLFGQILSGPVQVEAELSRPRR